MSLKDIGNDHNYSCMKTFSVVNKIVRKIKLLN